MPIREIRTHGGTVARFFETCFQHTKGSCAGQAFRLEPWQQEFVDEFYRVDEKGRRIYRVGILGIPRGNGKSPLAAGFGLFELLSRRDAPDVFCAAGARDQARIVLDFARTFVESGPLHKLLQPNARSIVYPETNGVMRVLSSEGALQYGLSVSAAIADELHAFTTEAQEEVWNALFTALHKRVDSFALVITTAGFNKRTLLGRMYDQALELPGEDRLDGCLRIRRDLENGVLFWWYGIPESREADWRDERLWRHVNPASWVDLRDLRQTLHTPGFDELDFRRLHCNMWTKARDAWLPANVWDGLTDDDAEIPEDAEIYVGVDVGMKHDSTAVAWAHRLPDGRIVLRTKIWTTTTDSPGVFVAGGTMRLDLVKDHILWLNDRYRVREVGFDPRYFLPVAQELERHGLVTVEFLPSSGPMYDAYKAFYRAAMEGTIAHDGNRDFAAHVEATAADKAEDGTWRIRKLRSTNRIDATVAAAIAHACCELRSAIGPPQIYWIGPEGPVGGDR